MKPTHFSWSVPGKTQIVKMILLVAVASFSLSSCSKDDDDDDDNNNNNNSTIAVNSMHFETLYENLTTQSEVADSDWQIKAVATMPGGQNVIGFFRFDEKPTANGTFEVVNTHGDLGDGKCFVMVNYVDWSGTGGEPTQSFLANTSTNTVDVNVTIENGKVHATVENISLTGNSNSEVVTGVKMNFLEQ